MKHSLCYVNLFIGFVILSHIATVCYNFDSVDWRVKKRKAAHSQTDKVQMKSECIEACSCELPKRKHFKKNMGI